MEFTIIKYNVKSGDDYRSIAEHLMNQSDEYKEKIINESLVKKVASGIQQYRQNKPIVAYSIINLVKEIEFYLNIAQVYTTTDYKSGNAPKKSEDQTNYLKAVDNDFVFAIKYFDTYEAFFWKEFHRDGKENYGELPTSSKDTHIANGDRTKTSAMQEGYIYVFDNDDTLINTFEVVNGQYQEVVVTPDDVTHKKTIGPKRSYALIRNFFDKKAGGYAFADGQSIVLSKVKLSKLRLFGTGDKNMKIQPKRCGMQIYKTKSDLKKGADDEKRSGPQIFEALKNNTKMGYTVDFYRIINTNFSGEDGFYLLFPEPFNELKRRADNFQNHYANYEKWINDETHINESFIYSAVQSMIRQDSGMTRYLDNYSISSWEKQDSEDYRKNKWPVEYGADDLINWLESDILAEYLKNYLCGVEDEKNESLEVYKHATDKLQYTQQGAKYLGETFDDKYSYLSLSLALKPEYYNDNQVITSAVTIRKWNNVAFELFENVSAIFAEKYDYEAVAKIINIVQDRTGKIINKIDVQPLKKLNFTTSVVDVENFIKKTGGFSKTKTGKSMVFAFETLNLAIAIYALLKEYDEDLVTCCANVTGASLDFMAGNSWLFTKCLENKIGPMLVEKGLVKSFSAPKFIAGMNLISGVIDCMVGIRYGHKAFNDGEIGLSIGWGSFALGGALVAAGAAMKIYASESTVASGGTLSVPGAYTVVAGLILEGIGLALVAYFDNRDIKNWLDQSIFGDNCIKEYQNTSINNNNKGRLQYIEETKRQIQSLNNIMCDFRVKSEFQDVEMKFGNDTFIDIIIEPRVLTETSRVEFINVEAFSEARLVEMFFGNRKDLVTGASGSEQPKINLWELPRNCKIIKNGNGLIEKLIVSFRYNLDIDRVKGAIKIDVNSGTLQGLTKNFEVTA